MGVKEDYLFRRRNSGNYYVRLQFPKWTGRSEVKTSLGTSDYRTALELSRDQIHQHRLTIAFMQAEVHRSRGEKPKELWSTTTSRLFEDGEHTLEDGTRVIVTQGAALRCNPGGKWEPFKNETTVKVEPYTPELLAWVLAHKDLPEHSSPELTNMPLERGTKPV